MPTKARTITAILIKSFTQFSVAMRKKREFNYRSRRSSISFRHSSLRIKTTKSVNLHEMRRSPTNSNLVQDPNLVLDFTWNEKRTTRSSHLTLIEEWSSQLADPTHPKIPPSRCMTPQNSITPVPQNNWIKSLDKAPLQTIPSKVQNQNWLMKIKTNVVETLIWCANKLNVTSESSEPSTYPILSLEFMGWRRDDSLHCKIADTP